MCKFSQPEVILIIIVFYSLLMDVQVLLKQHGTLSITDTVLTLNMLM